MKPTTLGVIEDVVVLGNNGREMVVPSKIDTGAWHTSIDAGLLDELGNYPVVDYVSVANAHGVEDRPLVELSIILHGVPITTCATVSTRDGLEQKILVGNEALQHGWFLVDPTYKVGSRKTAGANDIGIRLDEKNVTVWLKAKIKLDDGLDAFRSSVVDVTSDMKKAIDMVVDFLRDNRIRYRESPCEIHPAWEHAEDIRFEWVAEYPPIAPHNTSLSTATAIVEDFQRRFRNYRRADVSIDIDPDYWK